VFASRVVFDWELSRRGSSAQLDIGMVR
jgi:hypothetical protein